MTLREELRKLARMVRTGLDDKGDALRLANQIGLTLSEIQRRYPESGDIRHVVEDEDQLKRRTLDAEFRYQTGQYAHAVETLAPVWEALAPRLRDTVFQPNSDPSRQKTQRLLRQKLWALLHYVFFKDYALDGHPPAAIANFKSIMAVVVRELQTPAYTPSGTLAIAHYFIGQAYRANRDFRQAEFHFLSAQNHICDRINRKLQEALTKRIDIDDEIAFKDVFCARIMSGLSWIALLEGRLTRAELTLKAAYTILIRNHHHQESLKVFIRVLLLVSQSRRAEYETERHKKTLADLTNCLAELEAMNDIAGQYRCATELARSYLDLAEFSLHREARSSHLMAADTFISKLQRATDTRTLIHYFLLMSRMAILRDDPRSAHTAIEKAGRIAKDNSVMPEHGAEIAIMSAILRERMRQLDAAENALSMALQSVQSGHGQTPQDQYLRDPVLEGECYLLRARIAYTRRRPDIVEKHLGEWDRLSHIVENYYLHQFASSLRNKLKQLRDDRPAFELDFNFEVFEENDARKPLIRSVADRVAEFERWLWDSIIERHADMNQKQRALAFGVIRHVIDEILEKKGLRKQVSDEETPE